MTTEPSIQDTAFKRALSILDTVGATYAIVYNGETYGTLQLAPEPKPRRRGPGLYPRGVTRAQFLPHLEALKPGDEARIPYGSLDPDVLQRNVCAHCTYHWGIGAYMARRYDGPQELRVLRFKPAENAVPVKDAAPIDQVPA
jgi:hypothetical protein